MRSAATGSKATPQTSRLILRRGWDRSRVLRQVWRSLARAPAGLLRNSDSVESPRANSVTLPACSQARPLQPPEYNVVSTAVLYPESPPGKFRLLPASAFRRRDTRALDYVRWRSRQVPTAAHVQTAKSRRPDRSARAASRPAEPAPADCWTASARPFASR